MVRDAYLSLEMMNQLHTSDSPEHKAFKIEKWPNLEHQDSLPSIDKISIPIPFKFFPTSANRATVCERKIHTILHRFIQDLDNFNHVCWVHLYFLSSHYGLRTYSHKTF